MIDLENIIKAKQIKWIDKIVNSKTEEWNAIGQYWLQTYDKEYNVEYFILKCSDIKTLNMGRLPNYYQEAIKSRSEIQRYRNITNKTEILNERLFGNDKIQHRKLPVFFSNWAKSGITKIEHIWKDDTWQETETILNKL